MKTSSLIIAALLATAVTTGVRAQSPAPAAPAPNEVIYTPKLPSPAELTSGAASGGATVTRIEQTGDQITATYKYASGQTTTVVYRPLAAAVSGGAATTVATATPAPAVAAPATTVVYANPATVYCYPADYYYPWGWFAPISLDLGFGFRGGYHGGFHGGFHGGGHWR